MMTIKISKRISAKVAQTLIAVTLGLLPSCRDASGPQDNFLGKARDGSSVIPKEEQNSIIQLAQYIAHRGKENICLSTYIEPSKEVDMARLNRAARENNEDGRFARLFVSLGDWNASYQPQGRISVYGSIPAITPVSKNECLKLPYISFQRLRLINNRRDEVYAFAQWYEFRCASYYRSAIFKRSSGIWTLESQKEFIPLEENEKCNPPHLSNINGPYVVIRNQS